MPRTVRLVSRKASAAANYREVPESDGENEDARSSSPKNDDEDEPYDEEPPGHTRRSSERTRSVPNKRTSIRVKIRPMSSSSLTQEEDDKEADDESEEQAMGMDVDNEQEDAPSNEGDEAEDDDEEGAPYEDETQGDGAHDELDDSELPYFSLVNEQGEVTKTQVTDRIGLPIRRKPVPASEDNDDEALISSRARKNQNKSQAASQSPVIMTLVDGVPIVKSDPSRSAKRKGKQAKPLFGRKRLREDEEDAADGEEEGVDGATELSGLKSMVRPGSTNPRVIVKKEVYELYKDELVLDEDAAGNTKIDEKGRLLGGRCFKTVTFSSPYREDPDVHYILSVDGARSGGFRDSLYFYRQNPLFLKVSLVQAEKEFLIQAGRLSSQLRGRNVTMLPVRNVFKCHGAKMIRGGRAVTDDYYEEEARAAGKKEGEIVRVVLLGGPAAAKRRDLDRERTRHKRTQDAYAHQSVGFAGEAVLTVFGDGGEAPFVRAPAHSQKRISLQRADLTERNWRLEMAKSVRGMNSEFIEYRKERLDPYSLQEIIPQGSSQLHQPYHERVNPEDQVPGLYDPYTHTPHFPQHLQSSSASIERVSTRPQLPAYTSSRKGPVLGGPGVGPHAWGIASVTTALRDPPDFAEPCYILPAPAGSWPEDTEGPVGEDELDEVGEDGELDEVDEEDGEE